MGTAGRGWHCANSSQVSSEDLKYFSYLVICSLLSQNNKQMNIFIQLIYTN